jgi:hypothetical protein
MYFIQKNASYIYISQHKLNIYNINVMYQRLMVVV